MKGKELAASPDAVSLSLKIAVEVYGTFCPPVRFGGQKCTDAI